MTVYLLWDNSWGYPVLAGVFSSEEKAKAWLARQSHGSWTPGEISMASIEPQQVDAG